MKKFEILSWGMENDRYIKIISIIGFTSILLALIIIAKTPPASGYEISIYDAYPWYFWVLLSIPLILQFVVIIFENGNGQTRFSYLTIFCALFSILVLLSLPALRGYLFYGAGDIHSHLGYIKEILTTSHIGYTNPYPGMHIWISILAIISTYIPETISLYNLQFLFGIYVVSLFLLSRSLRCSPIESLFITAFAIIPVLGYWLTVEYIMPSTDAFFLIPIVLFCIIKSRLSEHAFAYSILYIPFLLLFSFLHVETTFFLLITLIVISFVFKVDEKWCKVMNNKKLALESKNVIVPMLILLLGCFWFSSTLAFNTAVRSIYDAFILALYPATPPLISIMGGFRLEIIDVINEIIRTYGAALFYLVFGGLVSLTIFIKLIFKYKISFNELFLSTLFFIFVFLNVIFLSKGTSIGFHIFRQIKYAILISTLIIGLYFGKQIIKHGSIILYTFLIFLVGTISILAIYGIYSSPSTYGINYQTTYSDISGMNFFFNSRNDMYPILEICGRAYQTRFGDYLLGIETVKPSIRWGYTQDVMPPYHFGYYNNTCLGNYYSENQYLLIYPPSEEYYVKLYPNYKELWKFSPEDFNLLNEDSTVDCIYSNKNLKIMLVNGHKGK